MTLLRPGGFGGQALVSCDCLFAWAREPCPYNYKSAKVDAWPRGLSQAHSLFDFPFDELRISDVLCVKGVRAAYAKTTQSQIWR